MIPKDSDLVEELPKYYRPNKLYMGSVSNVIKHHD